MTKQTLPTNWPERVAQAARQKCTDFTVVLNLLIRQDPHDLRGQGMDAMERQSHYTQEIERIARAA